MAPDGDQPVHQRRPGLDGDHAWLDSSQVNWIAPGRPYPWTVQDSGFRALAAYVLAQGTPYIPWLQPASAS